MSSEISTKPVRLKADAAADPGLQPWQFFVLAALGCATAVTFIARGRGPSTIILLSLLMATAAFVGFAALRMLRPLMSADEDRTVMIGQRTRVALEREKTLALRSIKELEFDRAMGRLSDDDFKEMSGRLRVRAARLIKQLDAGASYRQLIERELQKRLGDPDARPADARLTDARLKPSRNDSSDGDARSAKAPAERSDAERICAACDTANDADAKFCKSCGTKL
jgi:hypothetical protein